MRQKGVVLFTVIVMQAVLTLLVLSLLQALLLTIKASNQLATRHHRFYQLEATARQLQSTNFMSINPECFVYDQSPNEMVKRLQHSDGCETSTAIYLIDSLGEYPCLQMGSHGNRWSTRHWLVSVATKTSPFELIQLRMAQKIPLGNCDGAITLIDHALLSWRHLSVDGSREY